MLPPQYQHLFFQKKTLKTLANIQNPLNFQPNFRSEKGETKSEKYPRRQSSRYKNLSLFIYHFSLKKGHRFKTIIPQPFFLSTLL
jgi:hypothetical protein